MTIHRVAKPSRLSFQITAAVLVLLPLAITPALANHRHPPRVVGVPTTYDTLGVVDRDQTGSIFSGHNLGFPAHSMRSSTLGNADFPERDPSAQNFGMTSGGGLN